MKLNVSKIFEGCFNLSEKRLVNSLEEGAKMYGGATKIGDTIYSNYNESDMFEIKDYNNIVGIIVPGTLDVNTKIDNFKFVNQVLEMLGNRLVQNVEVQGAWTMENGDVVIEDNNLITFTTNNLIQDLELLKNIAKYLKVSMSQEAISIIVNDSLAIY
jgi:hypothetical protein